jgi:hypothetical protein
MAAQDRSAKQIGIAREIDMTRVLFIATLLAAATAPAFAQVVEMNPLVRERIAITNPTDQRSQTVRVQIGVNYFLPGPTGEGEEAAKLRDRARQTIYEMAGRECAFLEQSLAKTCRLESINVNVNSTRQQVPGQVEGFMTNGNFALQITMK